MLSTEGETGKKLRKPRDLKRRGDDGRDERRAAARDGDQNKEEDGDGGDDRKR